MRHKFIGFLLCILAVPFALIALPTKQIDIQQATVQQTYNASYADPIRIRLIALKHSHISMADGDADLAISAVRKAAGKGLAIKSIGNHNIDKNGKARWQVWEYSYDLPKLKEFVSQQMKIDAAPGDTVIVFTIGHGFPSGSIENLGQRTGVMKAIADAAEENQQKTLWWQLSCHACAGLPKIDTLSANQQNFFSMLASSTAQEQSAAGVQGRIMEKVFMALANKDRKLDTNGDGIITAQELRDFLNGNAGENRRGDLLFARNMNEPIFGAITSQAREIPILDRNRPQAVYPRDYIPLPGR